MTKPTSLAVLPKPEFVANVDTANEEIVRLVGQYNTLIGPEGRLTLAEASVETLTGTIATSTANFDAQATTLKVAQDEVVRLTAENSEMKTKADAAGAAAVNAIAAAGVAAPVKVEASDALKDDNKLNTKGLTGLARAIAANTANQAKS